MSLWFGKVSQKREKKRKKEYNFGCLYVSSVHCLFVFVEAFKTQDAAVQVKTVKPREREQK